MNIDVQRPADTHREGNVASLTASVTGKPGIASINGPSAVKNKSFRDNLTTLHQSNINCHTGKIQPDKILNRFLSDLDDARVTVYFDTTGDVIGRSVCARHCRADNSFFLFGLCADDNPALLPGFLKRLVQLLLAERPARVYTRIAPELRVGTLFVNAFNFSGCAIVERRPGVLVMPIEYDFHLHKRRMFHRQYMREFGRQYDAGTWTDPPFSTFRLVRAPVDRTDSTRLRNSILQLEAKVAPLFQQGFKVIRHGVQDAGICWVLALGPEAGHKTAQIPMREERTTTT